MTLIHYRIRGGVDTAYTVENRDKDLAMTCSFYNDEMFGKGGNGTIMYNLTKCQIDIRSGCLSIWPGPKEASSHWLSFYNFDGVYTEREIYMNRLPRDYEARMKCSECGTVINKTFKQPGLYFIADTMWGLSSPFNVPRCPKCEHKTFSDINFGINNVIYRVSTNRPVNTDKLKILYSKELQEYRSIK